MYFDSGANVFVASTVTCGFKARPERSSSSTSSNQAVPVAFPQPPKRQLRERTSLAPLSKTSSTRVQSCVPVTALLRISVPWKLKSAQARQADMTERVSFMVFSFLPGTQEGSISL
jgi:hypothetical protein